jgi:tetratricopeptide (TPR) repeat protein
MSTWRRTFRDLPPDAVHTLQVLVLLGLRSVSADELAAIIPLGLPEATAAVDALRRAGWVHSGESGTERLVEDASRWLKQSAALTDAAVEMTAVAGRLARYHLRGLDVDQHGEDAAIRWAHDHRAGIVAAIHAANAAKLHDVAARVAAAAWRVADRVQDPGWWRQLARHGEDAASQGKDPATLITLLRFSAAVFAGAEFEVLAEEQWVRALKLADELGDRDSTAAVLSALGVLYRGWGRLDKALDTLVELVDEYQRVDEPINLAGALTELGATMLTAGRPADAPVYLARADTVLADAPTEATAALRARVFELWGQALWSTEQRGAARRRWHQALALLADVDEQSADRIRTLLTTDPGGHS